MVELCVSAVKLACDAATRGNRENMLHHVTVGNSLQGYYEVNVLESQVSEVVKSNTRPRRVAPRLPAHCAAEAGHKICLDALKTIRSI